MKNAAVFVFALLCFELSYGMNIMDLFKSMQNKEGCKDRFCTRCLSGWMKNHQRGVPCVKSCADGFYKHYNPTNDEYSCRSCRKNCKECSDWLNCDVCGQGYSLMETAFRRCVAKCPSNFITTETERGQICQLDTSGCTDESCTDCQSGMYLLEGWIASQCVGECPNGYYGAEEDGMLKCRKCLYNCERCSSGMSCDKCMAGYSLVSNDNRFYCLNRSVKVL
ncbi:proprotein convertase subtilisin/kexin type 5 [Exaiptasia diaphana]|uniref:Uncharacterized protein n=1 Tax=Exaiptasia diaphana TaxID=2652724 RepID=A0A913XE27_EXADI|nr:proprotein convertase subtilisin/kexin type 5 [Exaiptasia diaphana]KXJ26420.1 Extracellular matrix protein FRAS1 [Exaiptasia diaphana]